MAKQTFTTGDVLTATAMNNLQANDYNWTVSQKAASYVLVAADKGTRIEMNAAGATTITVNTGLFSAGDTLFIQNIGAGVTTITAGTATVQKASNASLALAQYQGGYLYFVSASNAVFFADAGFTSPLTTKGDLFTWDTANARLAVGANDTVLTADSTTPTGLKWAAASSGGSYLTWTPVLKQGGTNVTFTTNSGSYFSRYTQVGKMTHVQFFINVTGTGSANINVNMDLPVNANKVNFTAGTAHIYDASSGLVYSAEVFIGSSDLMYMIGTTSNLAYVYLGDSTAAFSAALASSDQIVGSYTYESV